MPILMSTNLRPVRSLSKTVIFPFLPADSGLIQSGGGLRVRRRTLPLLGWGFAQHGGGRRGFAIQNGDRGGR